MLYPNRNRIDACKCAASGCQWAASTRLPMCLSHWHKVPGSAQADIWRAYRAMPQRTPLRHELMENVSFVAAMAEAVEHLAALEGRSADNPFRAAAERLASEQYPDLLVA